MTPPHQAKPLMQLLGNVASQRGKSPPRAPRPTSQHQERGPCPSPEPNQLGPSTPMSPEQLIGRPVPIKAQLEDGRHRNQRKHRRDEDSRAQNDWNRAGFESKTARATTARSLPQSKATQRKTCSCHGALRLDHPPIWRSWCPP